MSPTYQYRCPKCGYETTKSRKYEDRLTPVVCSCEAVMEYVFSAPLFFFEGGSPTAKLKSQVTSKDQFLEGMEDDE